MAAEAHFGAMGTDAHVLVVGDDALVDTLVERARRRIQELEAAWSRFRPDSDVARWNQCGGVPCAVSEDTILLVRTAVAAHQVTGGRYDPTVLGDVVRNGYATSFDRMGRVMADGRSGLVRGAGGIEVDPRAGTVRMPADVGFDPGGIGKGLAADLVVDTLRAAGAEGACVNLGGDLRVWGDSPDGGPWRLAVEDPWGGPPRALLALVDGAVATSTTLRRRWHHPDGQSRHHVIDPVTGRSSDTGIVYATAVAGRGWQAEALATCALLGAPEVADSLGAAAMTITADGRMDTTARWSSFEAQVVTS